VRVEVKLLDHSLCLVQVYSPNTSARHLEFMRKLVDAVRKVKANESMILLGDFNVHVGNDAGVCVVVIGKHGHSDVNSNGRCGMWIMNTFFQHRFFGSLLTH